MCNNYHLVPPRVPGRCPQSASAGLTPSTSTARRRMKIPTWNTFTLKTTTSTPGSSPHIHFHASDPIAVLFLNHRRPNKHPSSALQPPSSLGMQLYLFSLLTALLISDVNPAYYHNYDSVYYILK